MAFTRGDHVRDRAHNCGIIQRYRGGQLNYTEAEQYLNSFINYEQIPGVSYAQPGYSLDHIKELLDRIGNPQFIPKTVHVSGTKGKGSVAAMVAQVLTSSGYRTALYTSPHLLDVRERIKIDGSLISKAEFARVMSEIKPVIESVKKDTSSRQPAYLESYFEVLTVLAFAYFKKKHVDFQVLEVGLGGRLDATNVVNPIVCIVTSISLDHTQVLGNTLEEIARDEAGIIKPGCWVVISPQPEEAASAIADICHRNKSKVVQVGKDVTWHKLGGDLSHQRLVIQGRMDKYEVSIPLLGDFQLENAAAALAALEILASQGFAITATSIAQGLSQVKWPGRFQIVQQHPTVVIDGAHNVESIRRLVNNIKAYFPNRRTFLVLGISLDKDIRGIIGELVPLSAQIVVTKAAHPRAAPASTLAAEFANRGVKTESIESVAEAILRSLSVAKKTDVICVTGSLFVVAEALRYFSGS